MTISKILVANRGEIAIRVFRTARRLGYRTVAVYSEADADSPHVTAADEAVCIGPAAPAASYLRIEAVIEAALRTGADAIHPGYGFLSENADFADACVDASITFIGPPADAIRAMADKACAKAKMIEIGVPVVPGYDGSDPDRLVTEAEAIGVPLLVKAVAGGGGRGMRVVRDLAELPEALGQAEREATSAFGDGTLMLEAFVEAGRHIEIQVFADTHGTVVHLAERDCTPQRRRQKVIEEAPSPAVDAALRARMGADAVRAAAAIGYVGAGTVEFIVDADGGYAFLEMNTRLQVEHPVTEAITGVDLVAWQIAVAEGGPVPKAQAEIPMRGHAIEARVYAEDPTSGFAPQTGTIHRFRPEALADREGIRIDAGIVEGGVVTPHYDAMIAKVIAHGTDRREAIRRLVSALTDLRLTGIGTNQAFLVDLLGSAAFAEATLDTGTLDRWAADGHDIVTKATPPDGIWALAAVALAHPEADGFRSASLRTLPVTVVHEGQTRALTIRRDGSGHWRVGEGEAARGIQILAVGPDTLRYVLDGVQRSAWCDRIGGAIHLGVDHRLWVFSEASVWPEATAADDPRRIEAPVAGTVVRVDVAVGDRVRDGDTVARVEAMKMETRLLATRDATVVAIHTAVGDQIEAGGLVVEVEPLEVSDG